MDRYKGDVYMQLLRQSPYAFMAYFLNLHKELQIEIAMKFFKNHVSNAWEVKINGLKVAIEIKAQEMWME